LASSNACDDAGSVGHPQWTLQVAVDSRWHAYTALHPKVTNQSGSHTESTTEKGTRDTAGGRAGANHVRCRTQTPNGSHWTNRRTLRHAVRMANGDEPIPSFP